MTKMLTNYRLNQYIKNDPIGARAFEMGKTAYAHGCTAPAFDSDFAEAFYGPGAKPGDSIHPAQAWIRGNTMARLAADNN